MIRADARPVALYGRNGAGKTNVLEAVSFLSPGRGIRGARADAVARSPENLGWKVTAELQSLGFDHHVETSMEPDTPRKVQIDGKSATQTAMGRLLRMVWLVPSMDRLWTEGAEGRRRFLDRITLSFVPDHADVSLAHEKAMRERNRLLKDGGNDAGWYRALERRMAESAQAITTNRRAALERISAAQAHARTVFPAAGLELRDLSDTAMPRAADDLAELLADHRPRDIAAGRTLIGPHRADLNAVYTAKGIAANSCSTGEQKALLISVILANARALALEFGAPPIILLDEVAAHLDQDRRAALYDEICAMKAQAWMTGTEAGLFQSLAGRARFFEVSESGGSSEIMERDMA